MPYKISDSGGDANSVLQGALHPTKKVIYPTEKVLHPTEKVLHPTKNSAPLVQNAAPLHFHPSQIPWLWLGLTVAIMIVFVLGFFAYSKFKIGRKPSLGKRNSRMTTIRNRVDLCKSLVHLKDCFRSRQNAKSEQYQEYFEALQTLQKDFDSLINDAEKRAFNKCIDTCSKEVDTAHKLAMSGPPTLVKYGVTMGGAINALIVNLSTSQNSNAASCPASFQNLEQSGFHQNGRVNAVVSAQAGTSEVIDAATMQQLKVRLDKEERTVKEKQRKIDELNAQLSLITNTTNQNKLKLENTQIELERIQKASDSWIKKNTTLEEKLNVQEAMYQRLNGLMSPVHARASLPQDAAPWSELDNYVQNLLGFADLIELSDMTGVTAKLNELQKVLFGPPPMNSLFDPERPAPVDVFTRILYLQSYLRAKLREQNIQIVMPEIGENYDARRHECAETDFVWDHDDPSKHNTIYAVRTIGFENRATGQILKKATVRKQMFDGTLPPDIPDRDIAVELASSEVSLLEAPDFPVSGAVFESELTQQDIAPTADRLEPISEIAPNRFLAPTHSPPAPIQVPGEVPLKAEMTPVMSGSREEETEVVDSTLANDNTLTDPLEERRKRIAETVGEKLV